MSVPVRTVKGVNHAYRSQVEYLWVVEESAADALAAIVRQLRHLDRARKPFDGAIVLALHVGYEGDLVEVGAAVEVS